jgi:hypothetical protein
MVHGDVEVPAGGELIEVVARDVWMQRKASSDLAGSYAVLVARIEVDMAPRRVAKSGRDSGDDRGKGLVLSELG